MIVNLQKIFMLLINVLAKHEVVDLICVVFDEWLGNRVVEPSLHPRVWGRGFEPDQNPNIFV